MATRRSNKITERTEPNDGGLSERIDERANRIATGDNESPGRTEEPKSDSGVTFIDEIPTVGTGEFVDSDTSGDGFGNVRKRRGRPPRNATKEAKTGLTADIEALLISAHLMAASFLHIEELALDEQEAKRLSDAIKKVGQYYPVGLSPKKLAIIELGFCAVSIYGPRAVAIYKKQKPKAQPRVVPMPQTTAQQTMPSNSPAMQANQKPAMPVKPSVPSELWNETGEMGPSHDEI